MKYSEVLKQATEKLSLAGNKEAKLDAWYLMEEVSKMSRTQWYLDCQNEMPKEKQEEFNRMLLRLLAGEPVSYIIGTRGFMGYDFVVDENVLIPRQDTELLVEKAIIIATKHLAKKSLATNESLKVLDMCTGSGCIAISIDKMLRESGQQVSVSAADISEGALKTATLNNERLGANVEFIHSDMFDSVSGKYNMIVSNPPYIESETVLTLDENVRNFEPHLALDGGQDGLDFYPTITKKAFTSLSKGGTLAFEIGYNQGVAVTEIMKKTGFENVEIIKDLASNDRVVIGSKLTE